MAKCHIGGFVVSLIQRLMDKKSLSQSGYILYLSIVLLLILCAYGGVIITSQHLNIIESRRSLNALQASVMAWSGLYIAQAYAAGYEGRGALWETQDYVRSLPNGGGIALSAHYEAGWLQVKSKGAFLRDTAILEGILGQSPPSFSSNVLSLCQWKCR
jgi:hypothetical protein